LLILTVLLTVLVPILQALGLRAARANGRPKPAKDWF
jgi:hypothetical protein